jgi:hypothetical protein
MKTMNALRSPLVTIPLGIALGAGAAFGAVAATRGGETPAVQEAAPAPTGAAEQLDQMLRVGGLVGPIATNWSSCPELPGSSKLGEEEGVMGWVLPQSDPLPEDLDFEDGVRTPSWTIRKATRYVEGGKVIAWCGEAEGPKANNRDPYVQEPLEGTIVLVPNTSQDAECAVPANGVQLPENCVGAPGEYDFSPKGNLDLEFGSGNGGPTGVEA